MGKIDKKKLIIERGADIIHRKGFNNTGIQEILESAEIPKGSFYFYFKDKEDFGLQVIQYFASSFEEKGLAYYQKRGESFISALESLFIDFERYFEKNGFGKGCPIGTFAQEVGILSDALRLKVDYVLEGMKSLVVKFLNDARSAGEIDAHLDVVSLSDFIIDSWEGALIRMKVKRNSEPLVRFRKIVFETFLGVENEVRFLVEKE